MFQSRLYIDGQKRGECTLKGTFNTGQTCSVSISIDEDYQKCGYSKLLWINLIQQIEETIRPDQMIFIDADASGGYWEHIGFTLNRYGYDYNGKRDMEGKGYEKVITFEKLKKLTH